jgi:hypothetical protein
MILPLGVFFLSGRVGVFERLLLVGGYGEGRDEVEVRAGAW